MTWDNYGNKWVIDHIIPQVKFIYNSLDHPNFLECWKMENLRPLCKNKNLIKSDKLILISGCFDVLHPGHLKLFEFAKKLIPECCLLIALDSDEKVKNDKGLARPFFSQEERKFMLKSYRNIDRVIIFSSEKELEELLKLTKPDIRIVGADWKNKDIVGQQYCSRIEFFDRQEQYSTTKILNHYANNRM